MSSEHTAEELQIVERTDVFVPVNYKVSDTEIALYLNVIKRDRDQNGNTRISNHRN
jgi:hypothetical protein